MNALALAATLVQALGWCLVHFLWQATLVGALYALARWLLPRGNPRYLAAMLALVAMVVLAGWTLWHELQTLAPAVHLGGVLVTGTIGTVAALPGHAVTGGWLTLLQATLPWLVLAWACGVVLLGVRATRQWRRLRVIVSAAEALPLWQARARELGDRLGLARAIRVLASVRIATPTLVGWVRPAVVMPLAMLAVMPPEQVDLVLAHELAHLRRLDHFANLFQVLLEIVFFYHPVVHWISRDARNERELCCDALALRASGGKRRDFVAALAGLEEFRADHVQLALAASGGVLVERAWFVAGVAPRRSRPRPQAIAGALLALAIAVALLAVWRNRALESGSPVVPRVAASPVALPMPSLVLQQLAPPSVALAPLSSRAAPDAAAVVASPVRVSVVLPSPQLQVAAVVATRPKLAPLPVTAAASSSRVESGSRPLAGARPLHIVAPVYPPEALAAGLRGKVTVAFTLDAAGRPHDLAIVSAARTGVFDSAALQALAQWRFQPPTAAGRTYRQTFSFTPGDARGADVLDARAACRYVTGSHICRRVDAANPALTTLAPSGH